MTYAQTREETIAPMITAIIPVHNASGFLEHCLESLATSDCPHDCIVVNDGSTDTSEIIASRFPTRVLNLRGGPFGPAYARNRGAEVARGSILFFVDSDVVLAPGGLRLVAKVFQEHSDLAAVFGSYDAQPKASGVVSQYRNLLHHFVHQNGNSEASTFWAGCGAIRRSVFEEIGGFDETRFRRPSIEDIELGYRLRRAGHRILLDKSLQGTHLKQWTLLSFVRTDIVYRAIPWSRLILETKNLPNDLNLKWDQRASFALAAFALVFLALGMIHIQSLAIAAAGLLGVLVLNRRIYVFFFRQRGLFFALACVPLHILYYLYSGLSYLYVRTGFVLRNLVSF
ncbi:MAG TPA: glycosyltransferase [Candidatus Binatia bacterium]|jgi:GT2 family glycosyltransferase|nr:glycosyltransferase [Candidatus Binatia bacterium]